MVIQNPSGHEGLDNTFVQALIKTEKIPVPQEACLMNKLYYSGINLSYDERDMSE